MSRLLRITLVLLIVLLPSVARAQVFLPLVVQTFMPPCSEELLASFSAGIAKPVPITENAPGCQLPITTVQWTGADFPGPALPAQDEVNAADYFISKRLNIHRLSCISAYCSQSNVGMGGARAKMSWRRMDLTPGQGWTDRFYGSWMALGDRNPQSANCTNWGWARRGVALGVGIGRYSADLTRIDGGHPFFYRFMGSGTCEVTISSVIVPRNINLTMVLNAVGQGSNYTNWEAKFWWGGTWMYIHTLVQLDMAYPDHFMVGGEMGAVNGDFSVFKNGWTQTVEHTLIRFPYGGSWYSYADDGVNPLPLQLNNASTYQSNSPFTSIGYQLHNHTSTLWHVLQ